VLAVIEYNYEREGNNCPSWSESRRARARRDRFWLRAHPIRLADDADGAVCQFQAVATDLESVRLGKSRGEKRGKNVLVRSLSGSARFGATLVGRGIDNPLSESDFCERGSATTSERSAMSNI